MKNQRENINLEKRKANNKTCLVVFKYVFIILIKIEIKLIQIIKETT